MKHPGSFHPWRWMTAGFLSSMLSFVLWMGGVGLSGFDLGEECAKRRFPLDYGYLSEHLADRTRILPLSAPCNARDDLIPVWLNPAIIICLLSALAFLALSVSSFVGRRKAVKNLPENRWRRGRGRWPGRPRTQR